MDGELRLDLPLEEGVVELLVVDVDLAHLWANFLPHFGLHSFSILLLKGEKRLAFTRLVRTNSQ